MSINKLTDFAVSEDAQKSIVGLELERGFPKAIKPARQWFNYLFNSITNKINELTDVVNVLDAEEAYKVGDLYITTNVHTPQSVAQRHGYGTWQRFGQGKALIGVSETASDPEWTKAVGNVFGEYTHQLTVGELPSEGLKVREAGRHSVREHGAGGQSYASGDYRNTMYQVPVEDSGWNDEPHNITQPSIVIEVWKRVA